MINNNHNNNMNFLLGSQIPLDEHVLLKVYCAAMEIYNAILYEQSIVLYGRLTSDDAESEIPVS